MNSEIKIFDGTTPELVAEENLYDTAVKAGTDIDATLLPRILEKKATLLKQMYDFAGQYGVVEGQYEEQCLCKVYHAASSPSEYETVTVAEYDEGEIHWVHVRVTINFDPMYGGPKSWTTEWQNCVENVKGSVVSFLLKWVPNPETELGILEDLNPKFTGQLKDLFAQAHVEMENYRAAGFEK
jgi:hypothetical protein